MAKKLFTLPGDTSLERRQEDAVNDIINGDGSYENYIESLSETKKKRIEQSVSRRRHGMHTVAPIQCMGPSKCPFFSQCPIPERDENGRPIEGDETDYPLYRPCVFEMTFLQQKTVDYLLHLKVDPSNPVEMAIVNELAILDLYKQRGLLVLSNGDRDGDGRDFLKVDINEMQGEHGMLMQRSTQLHPVVALLNSNESRRAKILEQLMETRKARADQAYRMGDTQISSALRNEIEAIRKALQERTDKKEVLTLEEPKKTKLKIE
jgi:hypothetical protein